jgi:hypothetical protein
MWVRQLDNYAAHKHPRVKARLVRYLRFHMEKAGRHSRRNSHVVVTIDRAAQVKLLYCPSVIAVEGKDRLVPVFL